MKRTLLVLIAVLALTVSAVTAASATRDGSDDASAAKKKTIKLKPGKYTYVAPDGDKQPVKVTKKGKRITVSIEFFDPSRECVRTVKFGKMKLTNPGQGDLKYFASGDKTIKGNSNEEDPDAGGGIAWAEGNVNKYTLAYSFNFSIKMENYYGYTSCFEFPSASGKLKKAN
ncbi:MAG TPA: hypothetical protein VD790_04140 [Thermoleophilaceae bacterium]|nr:hypothetical protein [Thermoleophilaceae bacterium]